MSTTNCRGHSHRGVALLIVLATLMVAATATTILLSAASDVRVQRELDRAEVSAQDLLGAMDTPIQHWLVTESSKAVLPPDALLPAVNVLHDQWIVEDAQDDQVPATIEVTITAFDQCGMVPMRLARSGSPLRLSLPAEVLVRLDAVQLPAESDRVPLGLDLFKGVSEFQPDQPRVRVFPLAANAPARWFGMETSPSDTTSAAMPQQPVGVAIGGLIATHNNDPVRINVNTAPMPLIEAAMRAAGFDGLEQVVENRAKGKPAKLGAQGGHSNSSGSETLPQIVSTSDRWSFRIDLYIGNLRQSWWATYAPDPDDPNTSQREAWMCVQRLAITE